MSDLKDAGQAGSGEKPQEYWSCCAYAAWPSDPKCPECKRDHLGVRVVKAADYDRLSAENATLREQRDAMCKAGKKLGKLAEIICTDYSPTRKVLCELDDARMDWDAALSLYRKGP